MMSYSQHNYTYNKKVMLHHRPYWIDFRCFDIGLRVSELVALSINIDTSHHTYLTTCNTLVDGRKAVSFMTSISLALLCDQKGLGV